MFARLLVLFAVLAVACGFNLNIKVPLNKAVTAAIASVFAVGSINMPANALTKTELNSLNYLQVKGTGLANRCPEVKGDGSINVSAGKKYKVTDLCIEPKSWQVEEEVSAGKGKTTKEFVTGKLMTRQTYTLEGISGTMEVKDGKLTLTEEDGIDYAAATVQLPGVTGTGVTRIPYLFSVKNLVAKGNSAGPIKPGFEFGGAVTVPSYRTGLFLDPKGRGTTVGYDQAGALPGLQNGVDGDAELFKENNKVFDVLGGNVEFSVINVNAEDGDFGGVFVSKQASDTDMGGKEAKTILTKGSFYGHIDTN